MPVPETGQHGELLNMLWSFIWDQADIPIYENWLYSDGALEKFLGTDLYTDLISVDYANREETAAIRDSLKQWLVTSYPDSWFACTPVSQGCAIQTYPAQPELTRESIPLGESDLVMFLFRHAPSIKAFYIKYISELWDFDPWQQNSTGLSAHNAYGILAHVISPTIQQARASGTTKQLEELFVILDWLLEHGDSGIKNEIGVVFVQGWTWLLPKFFQHPGPILRSGIIDYLSWLPLEHNSKINNEKYKKRWREELDNSGGLEKPSLTKERRIKDLLFREFEITQRCCRCQARARNK